MSENRAKFNNALVPTLFAMVADKYGEIEQGWQPAFTTRSSKYAWEESSYYSGFGYMVRKPEGTPKSYDERIAGPVKRWVHETFALGVRITEEAIEDVQFGIMKSAAADLGRSAAATQALLRNRILMEGDTLPPLPDPELLAGDGLPIFSPNHVRLGGGTWSNLHPVAADPTEATVSAAVRNFELTPDHRGILVTRSAKAIMCGPETEMEFVRILESEYQPGTANNDVNALKSTRRLKLHINRGITDRRWFVLGDKDPDIGLIAFNRVKPTVGRHDDFETGDAMFSIRARWSQGANNPMQIYLVQGL